jgi:hypothetical protein
MPDVFYCPAIISKSQKSNTVDFSTHPPFGCSGKSQVQDPGLIEEDIVSAVLICFRTIVAWDCAYLPIKAAKPYGLASRHIGGRRSFFSDSLDDGYGIDMFSHYRQRLQIREWQLVITS